MRIASFSVIELLVVMVIFSVTIGIGLNCSAILNKQVGWYIQRTTETLEFQHLDQYLAGDIENAIEIKLENDSTLSLVGKDNLVEYHLSPTRVFRLNNGLPVIFHIKMDQVSLVKSDRYGLECISGLEINVNLGKDKLKRLYRKEFAAEELLWLLQRKNQ